MLRKPIFLSVLFSIALVALAGCSVFFGPGQTNGPATATPVQPTGTAEVVTLPTSEMLPTIEPGATPIPQGQPELPTLTPLPAVTIPAPTQPALPTPHGEGACTYRATFLADVSVPDNEPIAPGAPFIKIWSVRNDGTCSWGPGMALHSVVFVGGSFSGPANSAELPGIVNPGQSVDVSVPLTSPGTPGIYRSDWKFKVDTSPSGPLLVGVGASSVAMYAQIVVPAGAPTAVPGARITFAPGATQAFVNGSLAAGQAQDYLININGGQTMILTLSTPSAFGAKVSVLGTTGPNPNVINANPEGSYWLGTLPVTQDYIIRVQAGAAPSTFSLNVVVPQRISFAPGAISASTPGTTSARRTVTYLLKANAQQTMTVTLLAPPSSSAITIYGLTDGQPLVRYVSGAMTWTGQLPATQDYVIEVVPATDATVNYILNTFVQ